MKALLLSVALWSSLAGTAWLIIQPNTSQSIGILFGLMRLLSFAAVTLLTWLAASALPRARFWRWSFWMVTLAGWLAALLCLQGRLENPIHSDDRQILYLALGSAAGAAAWLIGRGKRFPRWATLGDMAAGSATLALLGGLAFWKFSSDTAAAREQAVARWSEIGMPLTDIERTFESTQETAGSQAVRQAFRDVLSQRFYKEGTPSADREPVVQRSQAAWDLVNKATEVLYAAHQRSDSVTLPAEPAAALEAHSAKLDAAYRQILSADPAIWACNPRDGVTIAAPNYLGLRMFAQLSTAESLRRLTVDDIEGAKRAISACKHMTEGLDQNPTLVSLMIHVAVEALLAPQEARLEIAGSDRASLERAVVEWRQAYLRVMQWESWAMLHMNMDGDMRKWTTTPALQILPRWTHPLVDRALEERHRYNGVLNAAERAALRLNPATASLPDFGEQLDEEISAKIPTSYDFSSTRSLMRMHVTLLLREQAQLIREARAKLALGQGVEARPSVVLPNARWEASIDHEKRTVSLRMVNAPKWIQDNVVAGPNDFWLLPLDGSAAWQFNPQNPGAAAVNAAR